MDVIPFVINPHRRSPNYDQSTDHCIEEQMAGRNGFSRQVQFLEKMGDNLCSFYDQAER
jgi:hypothetical protein